jgi:hypothetical protein
MAATQRVQPPVSTTEAPAGRLPPGFDGPRACGPFELAPDLDMINLVFRTQAAVGVPRAPNMGWAYSHVYNPANLENVRIVCHQGQPVSSVGIHPTEVQTPRGAIGVGGINAVGTHPDFRHHGLASLTMLDAHARMREIGMHVGLLGTGISNWYRKLGWERAGQQRSFTFDRSNVTYLPDARDLDVTEDWRAHVDELCALHNSSAAGAVRTPALFTLLAARKAERIFVARQQGRVVAYAAVGGAAVREYAGDTEMVAALLRQVFAAVEDLPAHSTERRGAQQGQFELSVTTPAAPTGLPALLLDLGIPNSLGYLGMLLILDAPGLFDALKIDVGLERTADGWQLRHDGHTLHVTERELTKLVFGPERWRGFAPDLFPIDFYQWSMDRV